MPRFHTSGTVKFTPELSFVDFSYGISKFSTISFWLYAIDLVFMLLLFSLWIWSTTSHTWWMESTMCIQFYLRKLNIFLMSHMFGVIATIMYSMVLYLCIRFYLCKLNILLVSHMFDVIATIMYSIVLYLLNHFPYTFLELHI